MADPDSQLVRLRRVPRMDHETLAQTRVRGNDCKVVTSYGQNGSITREYGHVLTDVPMDMGERCATKYYLRAVVDEQVKELLTLR